MELLKKKMDAEDFDALVSLQEKANQILLEEKEHGQSNNKHFLFV